MPSRSPAAELPILLFADARTWGEWLDAHHADSPGVWLRLAKKSAALQSLSYAEALDEALCHGWIDSQKKPFDDESWLQRFTPRGPRSIWSRVNRDKVEALRAAGRMKPAGLEQAQRARDDGRWAAAYASQSKATVPDDLRAALDANPGASAFFSTLDSANRYAILFRVHAAKKPETRARKIAEFVAMLERGEKIHG